MGIYSRLRNRLHDGGAPRTLSVKSYTLAEQIGPYLDVYIIRPAEITGPGRRPIAGTHGYASRIHPLPGHTWRTLRSEWNTWCRTEGHPPYWLYREARNFIRDAQNALAKTLYLQWRSPQ